MIISLIFIISSTVVKDIQFFDYNLQLLPGQEYTRVLLEGCEITDQIGAPELPVKPIFVSLPRGSKVTNIRVLKKESEVLNGVFHLTWAQPPVILLQKEIKKREEPDKKIYGSDNPYPEDIIQFKGLARFDNQTICELLIYPLQYLPASGKLIFYKKIQFAIDYSPGIKTPARTGIIKTIATNPEDVEFHPARQPDDFDYVIISDPPIDTVFQRLADWKTKKGVRTMLRTKTWILSHYPGEDEPAKIRNYIKTLPDSGVQYILLGGDTDIIPCRFAYAMTCEAGYYPGREDTMPADLYFADLQGTWDEDNDGSYGEIEDSVDLYPDLFVGRAPVNTISEAQKFVEKVLIYERNPAPGYLTQAMFAADILWSDPYTDQGIHKNRIGNESFPQYFDITKLYRSQGNLTPAAVKNSLRQGMGLSNHDGHGWIDVIGCGTGYLHREDFDTLTNAPYYGIFCSIGCWTSAFDFNSISESFVNSPQGGGVAYIGNSSYGWGSPGNPGFGYSDRFDSRIFYSLFKENHFHLGACLALAKAHFIPYSREKNVYRWHQYQINLLGDPELPVWTDTPETLMVSFPDSIPTGNSRVLITVRDKTTGAPIRDALVCLMKLNESYDRGYTDASGSIYLSTTAQTSGNFDLTVSAHNFIPKEFTIPVISGSYVSFLGWQINDSSGNNDGIANPNEDIFLTLTLKNTGNATADNIQLVLSSQDPLITITDSTEYVGSLNPGDSTVITNAFNVNIGSASNGHGIYLELRVSENTKTIIYNPILLIGTPVFDFQEMVVDNLPTLPGDTAAIFLRTENKGYGYAHSPYILLNTTDPYVSILTDSVSGNDIAPESSDTLGPLIVAVHQDCPAGHHPLFNFFISAEGYNHSQDFNLIVGSTGFSDDMESGSALWTTDGTNNLWHISTRRSFSPSHSWYCGEETNGQYVNNMDCYIQTIPFMVYENSVLRFYRWFQVPIYGADGIYVIVIKSTSPDTLADTLDFIGTGGALESRDIQSEWFEEEYSLAPYAGGDTILVRISFISDNDGDVGEGFYIDDVNIENFTPVEIQSDSPSAFALFNLHPNPFQNNLYIKLATTKPLIPQIKVFDITGRIVKTLSRNLFPKDKTIVWDGTDDQGQKLPSGVYFIQVTTTDQCRTEKAILLR